MTSGTIRSWKVVRQFLEQYYRSRNSGITALTVLLPLFLCSRPQLPECSPKPSFLTFGSPWLMHSLYSFFSLRFCVSSGGSSSKVRRKNANPPSKHGRTYHARIVYSEDEEEVAPHTAACSSSVYQEKGQTQCHVNCSQEEGTGQDGC